MDEIRIKQLEVFAHHGVFPEENRLGQKFVISAALRTHLRTAGLTDDLTQSMDYGAVCAEIQTFLTQHTFQLLETAAEKLCEHLLQTLPLLDSIQLEIEKPWAPIGLPLKTAAVCIKPFVDQYPYKKGAVFRGDGIVVGKSDDLCDPEGKVFAEFPGKLHGSEGIGAVTVSDEIELFRQFCKTPECHAHGKDAGADTAVV